MRWRISKAKGSGTDFIGDAERSPISQAAQELWRKYIDDAAPKNAEIAWDHLRVEVWLDSGRIILYPATSPFRLRTEKSACLITCSDLLNFYKTLIEADLPDEQMESQLIRKENEVVQCLSSSARRVNLPEHLGRTEVRVLYCSYEGESGPIKEDVLKM